MKFLLYLKKIFLQKLRKKYNHSIEDKTRIGEKATSSVYVSASDIKEWTKRNQKKIKNHKG